MPTYICHGFRWQRANIRIFVILNDLEEAAPDWVVGTTTATLFLSQFAASFDFLPLDASGPLTPTKLSKSLNETIDYRTAPSHATTAADATDSVLRHPWSALKLLEEHDPTDTTVHTRPYAYVADYAARIDLGADIAEEMTQYEQQAKEQGGNAWFNQFRDSVEPEAKIGWYVVVCGDNERPITAEEDAEDDDTEAEIETEEEEMGYNGHYSSYIRSDDAVPQTATTTMSSIMSSQDLGEEWPLPNTPPPLRGNRDNHRASSTASHEFSHIKPPPTPVESPSDKPKRSLRRKLSIKRLFTRRESLPQD